MRVVGGGGRLEEYLSVPQYTVILSEWLGRSGIDPRPDVLGGNGAGTPSAETDEPAFDDKVQFYCPVSSCARPDSVHLTTVRF